MKQRKPKVIHNSVPGIDPFHASPAPDGFMQSLLPLATSMFDSALKKTARVEFIPQPFIGTKLSGDHKLPGIIVASRDGGSEVLFAARDGRPLQWIATGEFAVDPRTIASAEAVEAALKAG